MHRVVIFVSAIFIRINLFLIVFIICYSSTPSTQPPASVSSLMPTRIEAVSYVVCATYELLALTNYNLSV